MTPFENPAEPISAISAAAPTTASAEGLLPGFDRAAANVLGSGKFETATFALG